MPASLDGATASEITHGAGWLGDSGCGGGRPSVPGAPGRVIGCNSHGCKPERRSGAGRGPAVACGSVTMSAVSSWRCWTRMPPERPPPRRAAAAGTAPSAPPCRDRWIWFRRRPGRARPSGVASRGIHDWSGRRPQDAVIGGGPVSTGRAPGARERRVRRAGAHEVPLTSAHRRREAPCSARGGRAVRPRSPHARSPGLPARGAALAWESVEDGDSAAAGASWPRSATCTRSSGVFGASSTWATSTPRGSRSPWPPAQGRRPWVSRSSGLPHGSTERCSGGPRCSAVPLAG